MEVYKDFAAEYEEIVTKTPYYQNQLDAERRMFEKHIPQAKPGQWALDLGCGTGLHTNALLEKGYNVTALDISPEMLKGVQRKVAAMSDRVEVVQMDARQVHTLPRRYDAVIAFGSIISHFPEWEDYFKSVRTIVNPGAQFLMSCDSAMGSDYLGWTLSRIFYPNDKHPLGFDDLISSLKTVVFDGSWKDDWEYKLPSRNINFELYFYSMQRLVRYLEQAGFKLTDQRGANIVTCMIPSLVRTSSVVGQADEDTRRLGDNVRIVDNFIDWMWWMGTVWVVGGQAL